MELGKVFVDSVIVGQRHRALDPSRIEALAESMDALGLQQPISVYMDGEDGVHLITGLHRLEAARALRWEQIDASFIKMSPVRREMWEIAENLFRVDLSVEQRQEHLRRYAELLSEAEKEALEKLGQDVAVSTNKGGRGKIGVAKKVAEQTGVSVRTVQRALNPQPKPVPPPPAPRNDFEIINQQHKALLSAWERARPEARENFLADIGAAIDTPVFDRSAA
jgi:hypothetical protein